MAAATLILGLASALTRALVIGAAPAAKPAAKPKARRPQPTAAPTHETQDQLRPQVAPPAPPGKVQPPAQAWDQQPEPASAPVLAPMAADALAQQLHAAAHGRHGLRVLLTGTAPAQARAEAALDLADALVQGAPCIEVTSVLLLDWAPEGTTPDDQSLTKILGIAGHAGVAQLVTGNVDLSEVVHRLDGTSVDIVGSGAKAGVASAPLDSALLNSVLDGLDATYSFVILVADDPSATQVFERLDGRFDVGIVVVAAQAPPGAYGTAFQGYDLGTMGLYALSGSVHTGFGDLSHERFEDAAHGMSA